jgi:hypothetical protein
VLAIVLAVVLVLIVPARRAAVVAAGKGQITQKGEAFVGHDVSLNSVSDLIVKLATFPLLHVGSSLGVSRA